MLTDVLADRYDLGRRLGQGGMAEVYDALDRVLDRPVAVKVLRSGLADQAQERFLREARAAASLAHPNIVAVYDTGRQGEMAYLVMERVDGPDLARVLRDGPVPLRQATRIAEDVLGALAAAHARGIVHRDVKPGNILLARDGTAKLTDFGIAKRSLADTQLTATGQVFGTPSYLSPEQARGEQAGPASDLYAVGCVLYEMIAGHPPFVADEPMAVVHAHLRQSAPPLFGARPGVDMGLVRVVERALAKDPADRYADAGQMRQALAQVFRAPPPPTRTRVLPPRAAPGAPRRAPSRPPRRGAPPPGRNATPRRPAPPRRSGTEPWVYVAVAALALIVLVWAGQALASGGLPLFGSDDGDEGVDVAESAAAEDEGGLPSLPGVDAGDLEGLSGLLDDVRADPDAYGERADELVEGVDGVLQADGLEQVQRGAGLLEDLRQWTDQGELDPQIADRVFDALGGSSIPGFGG